MKQQHRWAALAVLAVGLCLVTMDAFAQGSSASVPVTGYLYEIINSSGETVQVRCSGGAWADVANGTTPEFECQTTNLYMRAAGNTSVEKVVFHACGAGATLEVTVTEASAAAFDYSDSCT